jgi:malate dehydrogenase (oxaloacetate-decarboxylating)(NADP+)
MTLHSLTQDALDYHAFPVPGKLRVELSKPTVTAHDLSLAYSPGVAAPVEAIALDPADAYRYTGKGNLVAVVSNGSAILGLGDLGPLASKPVMEGKGVLFRRFAGIDVFDIEVDERDPDRFVDIVAAIAPTFGGINLEDIAAPDCFRIERALAERCDIPVFHDDQHGTAVIVVAALLNALEVQGKAVDEISIVCAGAGAAGIATREMLLSYGVDAAQIVMVDRHGVIGTDRGGLDEHKQALVNPTTARTLEDAVRGADVFIGLSGPNVLSASMLSSMAPRPVVFALSNPWPEISPELAHRLRDDVVMATGRSDYPNQVNNVLGFPFIFRGALDVRARSITDEMKRAAVGALRDLAREPVPDEVSEACEGARFEFGPEYIIPKPLDPRLLDRVAPAVAHAAVASGVARSEAK